MSDGDLAAFQDRCRIPVLYRHFDRALLPPGKYEKALTRICKDWWNFVAGGNSLLLWGPYSSGKTALACWLLYHAVIEAKKQPFRYKGLFASCRDVATHIIEKTGFDSEDSLIGRMTSVDILVLDELVLNGDNSFKDLAVEHVIRTRIDACKTTIVTMNYSPDELKKQYEALAEPMQEAFLALKVHGFNFRQEKRTRRENQWIL